jgi:hypothetical protein
MVPARVGVADELVTVVGEDPDPVGDTDPQMRVLVLADRAMTLELGRGLDQLEDLVQRRLV